MQDTNWKDKHDKQYKSSDWIDRPSIFAQESIQYFPESGKILDLGSGQGQDSRYFAEQGYEVVSADLEDFALELNRSKRPHAIGDKITIAKLDMREKFPFSQGSFDVVYAHLSLHYFNDQDTKNIFAEIFRVLKPGGTFAFCVNSTTDPQYGTGVAIEPNYFKIDNFAKRFFDVQTAGQYAQAFTTKLLDNNGETYKDAAKGIHNLIRYIGTKPA